MIVAELNEVKRKELIIFFTLGSESSHDVSDWISRKINSGEIMLTDDYEENLENIRSECEKKFGERPKIVKDTEIDHIPVTL